MSWYSTPIQPIDPVVVSQQPKPPFRYVRDNFLGTGQHSYILPPAQDQSQWVSMINVQPTQDGILNQRWGYNQFASLSSGAPNRLYNFQSDSLGTRYILAAGNTNVQAYTEAGAVGNSALFSVAGGTSNPMRSVTSRNFQYFCNGYNALNPSTHRTGNSLKWNGNLNTSGTNAISNIGIYVTDTTANTSTGSGGSNLAGPDPPTSSGQISIPYNAWSNVGDIIGTSGYASVSVNTTDTNSNYLTTSGYGFNVGSTQTIKGIQVSCTAYSSPAYPPGDYTFYVVLSKNGTQYVGTVRSVCLSSTSPTAYTFGSSTDLWGTSWTPGDVNAGTFGAWFFVQGSTSSGETIYAQNAQVTIFLGSVAGGATSSGSGIGLVSIVTGGSINLTLGRTYYLVANTSTVGHFSDLSAASSSTGAMSTSEVNLLLASFNDPQVDMKYLLATADGGDPSILYEVQPLVPGLTISSWAIASNVVTFTGAWTGSQYTSGTTFYVGGLVHGYYMNGLQFTTTSASGTTLVAAYTHGNDSQTEIGVAGNYAAAIPNSVGLVVDNTPDPSLVTYQALLYTDQYGNSYGLALNDPPPAGDLLIKHQGRLWMAGVPGSTHSVYFSKGIPELTLPNGFIAGKYEEAWPGSNYFDVSDGAESVSGFLSDGTTLYIGTQNHIRRLVGNSPANFQLPQIVHPEVGLINQEVWQLVYMQGAPSGSIWMTPDFRVIQSDFNTYVDIGAPIQDILNALQSTAPSLSHATFVADGEYDLYILAVPYAQSTYCDTHLVYDLRNQQWYIWQPTNGSLSLMYNVTQAAIPQWLFINGSGGAINQYYQFATSDNGTNFPVTATTTWLHLGEPTRRKILNEIQIYGNTANLSVAVNGANSSADFASPYSVASGLTATINPFGTYVAYLIDSVCKHKYYQFSFTETSNSTALFLGEYTILGLPLDDL